MKLSTRYFLALAALTTSACLVFGAVDALRQYRDNMQHAGEAQQAEAHLAAAKIAAFLDGLATQLRDVAALPWSSGLLDERNRRRELHRLLKRNPAIFELRFVTASGKLRNYVSRVNLDGADESGFWPLRDAYPRAERPAAWYGPVYFREGSTPYVSLVVSASPHDAELLVAEVNLRYVTELVSALGIGRDGIAYVVDATDHVLAHPNLSFVHRKVSVAAMPQIVRARERIGKLADPGFIGAARSPDSGADVLSSAAAIPATQWLVFVEQPLDAVMAPVRTSIYRSLALLVLLLAAGLFVSRRLATKLTLPIVELERGAARIAAGDLSVRVSEGHGDEIQSLGSGFNRMAEHLGRSYAELESKVQQRTQALADANRRVSVQADELASLNAQLRSRLDELALRNEEAERANAAKTRFLAAASHDLRQPLQAISLLVEVLRERLVGRDVSGLVEKVQASVHALESLFVSLLDISRLDAGAIKPHVQKFSVASVLRLVEANFLPQALAKGLRLDIVHSSAVVLSDPALLERILSNLVSNAVRYTASGRVLVGCRRHRGRLHLLVVDTGPGIAKTFQAEIFEEFFQLANPERDRSKGLGLGLSIVKRTAAILQHPIILRSQPGRGSTFGIDVPLVQESSPALIAPRFSAPDAERFAGAFVLVIDDDKETRFAIEALCGQWGCHVVGADSAEAALETLEAHLRNPDLLICDYRLRGGRNGNAAIELIRRRLEDDLPAIVVTGDLSVQAGEFAQQRRVALLYKPINAERLWNAADRLLRATNAAPP